MANIDVYHAGESGKNYYAKPRPIDDTPWGGAGSDVISGVRNGSTNEIKFTLDDSVTAGYWIFERAGASPASTDTIVAAVPGPDPSLAAIQADITTIKNRETAQMV